MSILLTFAVYALMGLAGVAWTRRRPDPPQGEKALSRQVVTLTFEDGPQLEPTAMAVPAQGTAPSSDSVEGTGTIDPKILALNPVPLMEAMPRDVQDIPTTLPQQVRAIGDVRLPAAVGGTGLPPGHGAGNGLGGPKRSGWGIIRGVPGMNQGLDLNDLEAVHEEIPVYPMLAEWGHIQGDVVVRVTINEKGVPIRTELLEGPPMLCAETLRAVKRWRFGTGLFRGRKVNAVFDMTFRYTLRTR